MCRELSHPNARRCPSAHGENRRARDRANYTVSKSRDLTSPVDESLTAAPGAVPVVDLKEVAAGVRESVHTLYENEYGKNRRADVGTYPQYVWSDVEEEVRSIGVAVEGRASEIAGFTAEEAAERSRERISEIENDTIRELNASIEKLQIQRKTASYAEYLRSREDVANQIFAMQTEHDNALVDLLKEKGYGDISPSDAREIDRKVRKGVDEQTVADMKTLAEARLQALSETREMGGVKIETNEDSSKRVALVMEEVANYYPADWIRKSNEIGNLKVKDTKSRAHYSSARVQKFRVPYCEDRYSRYAPDGEGWVRGVYKGRGWWANPLEDPSAVEKYAAFRGTEDPEGDALWVRPRFKTRKAMRYYNGESVEGKPPRGWEEAHETLSDGQVIRVFRQPAYRMARGDVVAELTVDNDKPEVQWQTTAGFDTAIHEFAHRTEHVNPVIFHLEEEFARRRTTKDGEREKIVMLYASPNKEVGRTDSFADKYVGKEYRGSYREVMSTGMQGLFSGGFGNLAGTDGKTPDADMRAFILGVLATA